MFILSITDKVTAIAPSISANKLPFNNSIVFQTTNIVRAPNNAGKNFMNQTGLPAFKIIKEIQDVKGGTDSKPQARYLA